MKILLAHNSHYFPSHGGGDKSNRLLIEALAARGHEVTVVARIESFGPEQEAAFEAQLSARGTTGAIRQNGAVIFQRNGVTVHTVTSSPNLRGYFTSRIEEAKPDVIVTSTDDPAQLLYEAAIKASKAHIVYLIRATIAVPFGPHSAFPSSSRTDALRQADGVIGVSEFVARYARYWAGLDAVHVPVSLLDPDLEFPDCGSFSNEFITIANPCAVKGILLFVALAREFPHLKFAAVPTWGTSDEDWAMLRGLPNLTILEPVDNLVDLFKRTRVMLVPSLWPEARSRIVVEAMAHGIPVIASKIGGIPEAKLGVPYLVPVNPIARYRTQIDANMVPVAEVPPQSLDPWIKAVTRLTSDAGHYAEISKASRTAALAYAAHLTCEPFETCLQEIVAKPLRRRPVALSTDRQKALALLVQQRQKARNPERLSGLDSTSGKLRLFAFPHAGGGSPAQYKPWRDILPPFVAVVGVRPDTVQWTSMDTLIPQVADTLATHLNQPFAFFGHSMGAVIAYELAQFLCKTGGPTPVKLYVSAARAPHYRLNHQPGPEPTDAQLLEQIALLTPGSAGDHGDKYTVDRSHCGASFSLRGASAPLRVPHGGAAEASLLPILKADTSLYRRYSYMPHAPLDIPIEAFGGISDPNISEEQLSAWHDHTTEAFGLALFEGGHFYLDGPSQRAFLDYLAEDLARFCTLLTETDPPGVR